MSDKDDVRLGQVLPEDLRALAPLSLLMAPRLPSEFSEFPASLLLAMQLTPEMAGRIHHSGRGPVFGR